MLVGDVWGRRCSRCGTFDRREMWRSAAAAPGDEVPEVPPQWRGGKAGREWTCAVCGGHDFTVVKADSKDGE
jgi:hypothetical protein